MVNIGYGKKRENKCTRILQHLSLSVAKGTIFSPYLISVHFISCLYNPFQSYE